MTNVAINEVEVRKPIRRMLCCCCGGVYRGRQWSNQDTGYGLGPCCVEYVKTKFPDGAQTFEQCYGTEGIHFNIK